MEKKINKNSKIFFVGSGSDYHALDWYRVVQNIMRNKNFYFVTDLISPEGLKNITNEKDNLIIIGPIDKYLFKYQSKLGNIWRNLIKLFFAFKFISKLKHLAKENRGAIFHAHSMYYVFICGLANVNFIATPQGSDTLVRPYKSLIYKYFFIKAIQKAKYITVDSTKMAKVIKLFSNREASVIQNGIDTSKAIVKTKTNNLLRSKVISIRAFASNYRILEILENRNNTLKSKKLEFICPYSEKQYADKLAHKFIDGDIIHGFVNKNTMANLLLQCYAIVSIPKSDSSPRSVYEAIFYGCIVVTVNEDWYEMLSKCMKERVIITNIIKPFWLKKALLKAKKISEIKYCPSNEALEKFDQVNSMKNFCKTYY